MFATVAHCNQGCSKILLRNELPEVFEQPRRRSTVIYEKYHLSFKWHNFGEVLNLTINYIHCSSEKKSFNGENQK